MNSLQILSLFFNSIISIGSSVLLLYADIGIHKDIKELNVFMTSLFSVVNFYTIYSETRCDELGYYKEYKAVKEETLREDEIEPSQIFWKAQESNLIFSEEINASLDTLYNEDELYEEKI